MQAASESAVSDPLAAFVFGLLAIVVSDPLAAFLRVHLVRYDSKNAT